MRNVPLDTSRRHPESTAARSGGTSVLTLLGVAFIVLKLVGVIDWSWWLVTLPLWGGGLALFLGAGLVAALIGVVLLLKGRRR